MGNFFLKKFSIIAHRLEKSKKIIFLFFNSQIFATFASNYKSSKFSDLMKKLLLLTAICLLTATTAFADVQINETNFPDENFRAFVSGLVDGRDVITNAEIAEVREINFVFSQNISDLTGIKFFTYLEDLDCRSLQLTSLNVSGLTNLRQLLACGNQITSINLSNLPNLTVLFANNNQLTSLDVSDLPSLRGCLNFV